MSEHRYKIRQHGLYCTSAGGNIAEWDNLGECLAFLDAATDSNHSGWSYEQRVAFYAQSGIHVESRRV